jgi:pantoate--beta-alanine ligase
MTKSSIQVSHTIADIRNAIAQYKAEGKRIILVPTMGNLHEGHLELTRMARETNDVVVTSIFVNPLQFGAGEDFASYPRTLESDVAKLQSADVEMVFAPNVAELYPFEQRFTVSPNPDLSTILDGEFRPGHFEGVCTVVLKLLNITQPDAAVFGQKDYQQLMILKRMVQQFAMPTEIISAPIVRAADGLALSSRNGYLTDNERKQAPLLNQVLQGVVEDIANGLPISQAEKLALDKLTQAHWVPDYVMVRRQADLLAPVAHKKQRLVVLGAAKLGKTRLIDNIEIEGLT